MRDWSTRCCAGDPYDTVYPKPCIAESESASLTLVVTDFGTGSIDTFMANLTRARQALADAQTSPDTCTHLDACASYSLPLRRDHRGHTGSRSRGGVPRNTSGREGHVRCSTP
uniref:Uncharacterized protein n=1 Tax=Emiliania huxleyi TaxID=2903 RepID=A0A7S3TP03_EMIHU